MKDNILFAFLSFFLFFSSETEFLWMNCAVCKSNWRQGWTTTQRDAPACSFPHRTRINSMQQTTDSSFGIYSPLRLHPEKKCPYSIVTIGRNGSFLMLLPRGHAHSCSLQSPLNFSKLSFFKTGARSIYKSLTSWISLYRQVRPLDHKNPHAIGS